MDERSLIEIHSKLDADGWEMKVEMTNKSRNGEVIRYLLSNQKLLRKDLRVILEYPVASKSGEYELTVKRCSSSS